MTSSNEQRLFQILGVDEKTLKDGIRSAIFPNIGKINILAVGDSIVNESHRFNNVNQMQCFQRGFLSWLLFHLGNQNAQMPVWIDDNNSRGFTGWNQGYSGETSAQTLARWENSSTFPADIVIVEPGTNDFGTYTNDEIIANRKELCLLARDTGALVILTSILMQDDTAWTGNQKDRAAEINRLSREFAESQESIIYFDGNAAYLDYTDADQNPLADRTSDGTHPAPPGGYYIGLKLKELIEKFIPSAPIIVPSDLISDDNTYGNIITNPLFLGTSGTAGTGVTGDVADNWELARTSGSNITCAATVEARSDGLGNQQVATFTLSGSAEETFLLDMPTDPQPSQISTGDWVCFDAHLEVDNAAGAIDYVHMYTRTVSATESTFGYSMRQVDNDSLPAVEYSGQFPRVYMQIPDGNRLRVAFEIGLTGIASGTAVVKVSLANLRKCNSPIPS